LHEKAESLVVALMTPFVKAQSLAAAVTRLETPQQSARQSQPGHAAANDRSGYGAHVRGGADLPPTIARNSLRRASINTVVPEME
jgi:hypothetical protein